MSVPAERPIGFWLKRADEAITSSVNAALVELGLDRSRWQLLNVLATRPGIGLEALSEELHGFADTPRLNRLIAAMRQERIIDDELGLTTAGRELHQRALEVQTQVRKQAVDGISPDEYTATLAVLERIVTNLE